VSNADKIQLAILALMFAGLIWRIAAAILDRMKSIEGAIATQAQETVTHQVCESRRAKCACVATAKDHETRLRTLERKPA
jgi:hypothetical protein